MTERKRKLSSQGTMRSFMKEKKSPPLKGMKPSSTEFALYRRKKTTPVGEMGKKNQNQERRKQSYPGWGEGTFQISRGGAQGESNVHKEELENRSISRKGKIGLDPYLQKKSLSFNSLKKNSGEE